MVMVMPAVVLPVTRVSVSVSVSMVVVVTVTVMRLVLAVRAMIVVADMHRTFTRTNVHRSHLSTLELIPAGRRRSAPQTEGAREAPVRVPGSLPRR